MENLMMLLTDKNVHLLGGEYLDMDEPELSATTLGTDYAHKYASKSTPTTILPGAKA